MKAHHMNAHRMNALRVAVVAAALLAGGCAQAATPGAAISTQPTSTQPTPPSATGATVTLVPPPTTGTPVPAGQVDGKRQAFSDGRFVVVSAEASGCQQVELTAVEQSAARVVLAVVTTEPDEPGRMCPMYIREVRAAVHLDQPLGPRKLVIQERTGR
jgi:hypothetical protein